MMAKTIFQNLELFPFTQSQFTKQANVTTQLAENTLETNFLSIENLQVSKFCKPKGTIPNFWKSLLNSSCFFESEIKLNYISKYQ